MKSPNPRVSREAHASYANGSNLPAFSCKNWQNAAPQKGTSHPCKFFVIDLLCSLRIDERNQQPCQSGKRTDKVCASLKAN